MRARAGFTLWEMTMVLLVMTIVASLTAPALVHFGGDRPHGTADALLGLLHDARKVAIDYNATATLRIDPRTVRYEIDTAGVLGAGKFVQGKLDLDAALTLVTDRPRLQYFFRPTGAVFADSVIVQGGPRPLWVGVDPWSGVARAEAR